MLQKIPEAQRCKSRAGRLSVHVIADSPRKLVDLRAMLEPRHRVSCALLDGNKSDQASDAVIVAVDLRNVGNIAPIKESDKTIRSARKRIFLIDRKTHLLVVQAYALGATRVLFNPVSSRP
jgi:hypothetical protein